MGEDSPPEGVESAAKAKKKKGKAREPAAGPEGPAAGPAGEAGAAEGGGPGDGPRRGSKGSKKEQPPGEVELGTAAAEGTGAAASAGQRAAEALPPPPGAGAEAEGSVAASLKKRSGRRRPGPQEEAGEAAAADARPPKGDKKKPENGDAAEDAKKVKKKRAKNWTAGAAVDAALGVTAGRPPCMAFPIGEEVVVTRAAVLRADEDLESQEIRQLRKDACCRVVAHGTGETGRRLRVVDVESGQEGWISCVSQSGKLLLQLSSREHPDASAAGGAAPGAGVPAPEARASPQRPKAGNVCAAIHQPTPPKASPRPSGSALPGEVKAAALPAAAASPQWQASPEGPSRMELITRLFQALDPERRGRLDCRLLRGYAALCGFNESEEQWAKEYDALCKLYSWSAEVGANVRDFAQLVDDEDGAAHCTDEELLSVLEEVDHYGVPPPLLPAPEELPADSGAPPLCGAAGALPTPPPAACRGHRELAEAKAAVVPPKAGARSRLSMASISGALAARAPFLPLARAKPSDTE